MSSLTTLARPYARAAFELAQSAQALADWDRMLGLAVEMVSDDAIAALIDNPDVGKVRVLEILNEAAGDAFDERFRGFTRVLSDNGRMPLLPQVAELFRELREEAENRLRVKVVSAVPLDGEQSGRLKETLARRFECEIELENEIDATVIGGAVIYAGDKVIDGSLLGRLDRLADSLAN